MTTPKKPRRPNNDGPGSVIELLSGVEASLFECGLRGCICWDYVKSLQIQRNRAEIIQASSPYMYWPQSLHTSSYHVVWGCVCATCIRSKYQIYIVFKGQHTQLPIHTYTWSSLQTALKYLIACMGKQNFIKQMSSIRENAARLEHLLKHAQRPHAASDLANNFLALQKTAFKGHRDIVIYKLGDPKKRENELIAQVCAGLVDPLLGR